jgi:hypothetical protein
VDAGDVLLRKGEVRLGVVLMVALANGMRRANEELGRHLRISDRVGYPVLSDRIPGRSQGAS